MKTWDLPIPLEGGSPLFQQIAGGIADGIRRGRLRTGDPLPGSRTLAELLGVHRSTVLAAYRELAAQGFVTTRPAGATVVAGVPEAAPRAFAPTSGIAARTGFELGRPPVDPFDGWTRTAPRSGVIGLGDGSPDVRLIPAEALARASRRALRSRRGAALAYGDPRGHPALVAALIRMLASLRGIAASPENVIVTRGSQMALDLVARALVKPGDVVAVEGFGYGPAWAVHRLAGAELVPLPVDGEGLVVDALADLARRRRVRAVYVTPHHQYPTTVALSPARRIALLDVARRERIAVIEDDYDHEFHYEGRPLLPLASADRDGVVIYTGTLSKILAPGLRIGFVVAPEPLVDQLVDLRLASDRQGDQVTEAAVAELIEDGELRRHARRMRLVYGARREVLGEALSTELGDALDFRLPAGGMAVWARTSPEIDLDAWLQASLAEGVSFRVGRQFAFDREPAPYVRLGFATHDEAELREAVHRMKRALGRYRGMLDRWSTSRR